MPCPFLVPQSFERSGKIEADPGSVEPGAAGQDQVECVLQRGTRSLVVTAGPGQRTLGGERSGTEWTGWRVPCHVLQLVEGLEGPRLGRGVAHASYERYSFYL
jgi:hypothetical protein